MPKKWLKEKCVLCSLCTALCNYDVFKKEGGKFEWNALKCVDCVECLPSIGCPTRAITNDRAR